MATLYECDENDRFCTTSCDPYMDQTFRLFPLHFTIKMTQRMAFEKNAGRKNKLDKMQKD
jgi:hypothetical protein